MTMRYPIGIQTFSRLIREGYVYVDKTDQVWQLAHYANYVFLSRPRRFGKSLLLSTLQSYFEGRKELFAGLKIAKQEAQWMSYPVLHIDLNVGEYAMGEKLSARLNAAMAAFEKQYQIEPDMSSIGGRFENVIKMISRSTGKQVVILVDEYDKPLLEAIENAELQEQYRIILQSFYAALKSCDPFIRFAMLTGVTKFGKLSVFSGLNNLKDISMNDEFSAICGVTDGELSHYFSDDMERLARQSGTSRETVHAEIKRCYDGYRFSRHGQGIYNPFSLLNNFADGEFRNYWFETGTPTYLIRLLQHDDYELSRLQGSVMSTADRLGNIGTAYSGNAIAALYQTGYLTLKDYDEDVRMYRLGFPNQEVETGFVNSLLPYYAGISDAKIDSLLFDLRRAVDAGDVETFMQLLKAVLAGIPYESAKNIELNYRNLLFLVFTLLGCRPQMERPVSSGRIDIVLERPSFVYIFEFKLNNSAAVALSQIDQKHYADAYARDSRQILKVGVNFSDDMKNISDWTIE